MSSVPNGAKMSSPAGISRLAQANHEGVNEGVTPLFDSITLAICVCPTLSAVTSVSVNVRNATQAGSAQGTSSDGLVSDSGGGVNVAVNVIGACSSQLNGRAKSYPLTLL